MVAGVVQDRVTLGHARRLGERWSLSAVADGAGLRPTEEAAVTGPGSTLRVQLAASVGRATGRSITLGVLGRWLTFTDASPLAPATGPDARPLFWDPRWAFSAGPFASLDHELSPSWILTGRVAPGLALIQERRPPDRDADLVPQAAVEAAIRHQGRRLWTSLQLFYYQGQFDGYRSYGARVTVSARDLALLGGSR